jgi:cytochrome c peroxidase
MCLRRNRQARSDARSARGGAPTAAIKPLVLLTTRWLIVLLVVATTSFAAMADGHADSSVALAGKAIFFDSSLSADGQTSCATCHKPDLAFSDGLPQARGVSGKVGTRNTPSLLDVQSHGLLFWDGRAETLESQAIAPFLNPSEHGLTSEAELLSRIRDKPPLAQRLASAFAVRSGDLTVNHVAKAIAEYERGLSSGQSPLDRYSSGDLAALSASALRGLALFKGRGQCATCHLLGGSHPALTDNAFHNVVTERMPLGEPLVRAATTSYRITADHLGTLLVEDPAVAALGRFNVTKQPEDIGKFKTPSLRNVAVTAPYMHDGSIATLEEGLERELYYRSSRSGVAVVFTPSEKADLLALLQSMTADSLAGEANRGVIPVTRTTSSRSDR